MIKQDQEIFNILLETVPEAIIIVDDKQCVMEINKSSETIFGYSMEDIKGRHLKLLMPYNYHEKIDGYFNAFLKENRRRRIEENPVFYGLKKSGDIISVQVDLNPFKVYNKTYVLILVTDITKQKETEFDFMLRSKALESASNGILITDATKPDNPIIYFNPAFENLTGYSKSEVLNKNCRFLQGNDRDQKELDILRSAIKKGKSCLVTLRNYKKDGTLFWNDLYITPITNKKGVVTNFIGIQNDVTKRVRAEEEKNHLATIFNESLNEIYVFDAKTLKFINVNRGALENIGYTFDTLKSMTPLDLKLGMDEEFYRKNYTNLLLNNKKEYVEFEATHIRKDGTKYPVIVHLQRSHLLEKPVFVAIVLDVTEQKDYTNKLERQVKERTGQLQKALSKEKELNELKTKFLSLVSHEFKTPLSGILTSSVLLSKYKKEEEQKKRDKHITTIKNKVHYLNNILNDFLSLERLETGNISYTFKNFKLSSVIDEVIYNSNMLLKEGQNINYPEDISDISLYQDQKILALVLFNLLNNAIKYSSKHTTIVIDVKQNTKTTTIKITDQGIGIPKNDQKRIFDRYFRAENAINTQGTGIGLNIVKYHLENLGGTIAFKSDEKIGTSFTITLPNTAKE